MLLDSLGASKQPSWCKQATDPQVVAGEPSTAHGDTQGRFHPKNTQAQFQAFHPKTPRDSSKLFTPKHPGLSQFRRAKHTQRACTVPVPHQMHPSTPRAIAPTLTKAPRLAPSSNSHKIHSQHLHIPRSCPLSPSVTHWQAQPSRVRAARSNVAG